VRFNNARNLKKKIPLEESTISRNNSSKNKRIIHFQLERLQGRVRFLRAAWIQISIRWHSKASVILAQSNMQLLCNLN